MQILHTRKVAALPSEVQAVPVPDPGELAARHRADDHGPGYRLLDRAPGVLPQRPFQESCSDDFRESHKALRRLALTVWRDEKFKTALGLPPGIDVTK